MTRYDVTARHWKHGWELHIDGVGVTQSRNLAEAQTVVRDYVESLTGADASDAVVVVENIERHMRRRAAESRRDAIYGSVGELMAAVIGSTMGVSISFAQSP